jgi:flagellar basal-body rod modification protein FlgD
MTNTIDPNLYLSNLQKETKRTGSNILGKDDFLKILLVQLQNQDPLNPMQDKEFIAQMATFSSLEQITNMNKMMENFVNQQLGDSILKYSSMIGKEIEWEQPSSSENEEETPASNSGIVKSIKWKNNEIALELEDGTEVNSKWITRVSDPKYSAGE